MARQAAGTRRERIGFIVHDLLLCYAELFGDEDDLWRTATAAEKEKIRKAVGYLAEKTGAKNGKDI